MLEKKYIIAIIIVVIILLLLFIEKFIYNWNYLNGLWISYDTFLKEANLSQMYFFINDKKGYLLISDNDKNIVTNQIVDLKFNSSIKNLCPFAFTNYYTITISGYDEMKEPMNLEYSVKSGTLIMYLGKKIYAKMYKDHQSSSLSEELKEKIKSK
jgi:hypothetical protein